MSIKTIRTVLRAAYGARKYRITADGEIHVYGIMQNTNIEGWSLLGHVGDTYTKMFLAELQVRAL